MKKIFLIVLCVLLIGGCSTTTSNSAKDGTYTSTEKGFGGDVTVSLVVENGAFKELTIVGDGESKGYGADAIVQLEKEMNDAKSPDVDSISGATVTSLAVLTAAKKVFEDAGLAYDAKTVNEKGEDETLDCDVLVIGLGASGTMAAVNAAENGAEVIAVEATNNLGGMGNAAQGMFAIGTSLQEERYGDSMQTDEEYWYKHLAERSNQLGNLSLIRTFVKESSDTVEYLLDKGIGVYLSKLPQQIAHFNTDVVYHRWNDTKPFEILKKALDENNVDVHMNTVATKLLTDGEGNVVGAECEKSDGSILTVNAKATIVSTGGFAGNEELMKEVLGEAYNNSMVMIGTKLPGVEMMWDVGASKGELLTMNHGVNTSVQLEAVDQLTLNTPILWVNNLGKRFMSESLLKDTVEFSSAVIAQNGYAYTIIDQKTVDRWTDTAQENTGTWVHYWDRFGIVDEAGNKTVYHAPIDPEVFKKDFETLQEANEGIIADNLEEVAEFIGCDVNVLKETIANYNSYVKNGYDEEFFKDKEDLVYTVEEGPYYVTKGHSGVLGALGGVNVTDKLEVVTAQNKVIKGLYSTGNNVSGISMGAYVNVEGVGLGFSLTSGRLAGTNAAKYALEN